MKFYIKFVNDIFSLFQRTPLFTAVFCEYPEIVKLLLTHDEIDVNLKSVQKKIV